LGRTVKGLIAPSRSEAIASTVLIAAGGAVSAYAADATIKAGNNCQPRRFRVCRKAADICCLKDISPHMLRLRRCARLVPGELTRRSRETPVNLEMENKLQV
jgi:hypothetical protein